MSRLHLAFRLVLLAGGLLASTAPALAADRYWAAGDEAVTVGGCRIAQPLVEMGEAYRDGSTEAYRIAKMAAQIGGICQPPGAPPRRVRLVEVAGGPFCRAGFCRTVWQAEDLDSGETVFLAMPDWVGPHREETI